MSSEPDVIAKGWDEQKCREHLADLRSDRDKYDYLADWLDTEADQARRDSALRSGQIAHCVEMFGKPKVEALADAITQDPR